MSKCIESCLQYRVAIVGSDDSTLAEADKHNLFPICIDLGRKLSGKGVLLYSGGDGGVGREVIRGYSEAGGIPVIIFPGYDDFLCLNIKHIPVYSGLGYGIRDVVMLRSVESVIALGGGAGTLGEIANAYHLSLPIFTLEATNGWSSELSGRFLDIKKKSAIQAYKTVDILIEKMIMTIKFRRRINQTGKRDVF